MAPRSTAVASTVPDAILVGDWRVEPNLDRLSRGGESVKLEPRVMRLLLCLIAHVGQNLTVEELLDEVWPDVVVGPDFVYQAIAVLRARLGDSPHRPTYISHLPRRGYRLIAAVGGDVGRGGADSARKSASEIPPPAELRGRHRSPVGRENKFSGLVGDRHRPTGDRSGVKIIFHVLSVTGRT